MLYPAARMCCEAPDMQFVDDEFTLRALKGTGMSPVELLKGYPAAIRIYFRVFRRLFPNITTADFPCLGVEQNFLGIKPLALMRVVQPVETEPILDLLVIHIENGHCPDIAQSILRVKRNIRKGRGATLLEKHERA